MTISQMFTKLTRSNQRHSVPVTCELLNTAAAHNAEHRCDGNYNLYHSSISLGDNVNEVGQN